MPSAQHSSRLAQWGASIPQRTWTPWSISTTPTVRRAEFLQSQASEGPRADSLRVLLVDGAVNPRRWSEPVHALFSLMRRSTAASVAAHRLAERVDTIWQTR